MLFITGANTPPAKSGQVKRFTSSHDYPLKYLPGPYFPPTHYGKRLNQRDVDGQAPDGHEAMKRRFFLLPYLFKPQNDENKQEGLDNAAAK